MDRQFEFSNHKREHDEDNNDQNNRKKSEVPEVVEVADATINLTDVNDDCLVHIFKYLTLRDLISIVDTCKRFQASAQSTFVEKYRGKVLKLQPSSLNRIQSIKLIENIIEISDLTSCLKILRQFGVKISKLYINYYTLYEDEKSSLAWYMNEYCADSLIELKIHYAMNEVTTNWTKSFSNVEAIKICSCDLGDLNAWFPNLRRLMFSYSSHKCIKYAFPNLKELGISSGAYRYPSESITEMLRLNQHLQILRLSGYGWDMKFMESVIEYIQSVRLLDIQCLNGFFSLGSGSIYLKSVNEFHINTINYPIKLPKIPFIFDQLETIKLVVGIFKLNDDFKNFIRKNPLLTKLNIHVWACELNSTSIEQIKTNLAEVSPALVVEIVLI